MTVDAPNSIRIGTWNLEGKWSEDHSAVITSLDCSVWMLTEVPATFTLTGFNVHLGETPMGPDKRWAGVASRRPLSPLPDPHPASAAALVDGRYVCSSILPWPLAGPLWPWGPPDHAGRMAETVSQLINMLQGRPCIWGGDWNTPLTGNLQGFSRAAQASVKLGVESAGLQVPTEELPHRNDLQASIDHIAVPTDWTHFTAGYHRVGRTFSDHDPYWAEFTIT